MFLLQLVVLAVPLATGVRQVEHLLRNEENGVRVLVVAQQHGRCEGSGLLLSRRPLGTASRREAASGYSPRRPRPTGSRPSLSRGIQAVRKRSDEASRCRFAPCPLDCSHAALAQLEEA